MRLTLTAIILTMLAQPVWSDAKTLDHQRMKGGYALRTICVDGYKFVVTKTPDGGVAISQFYEVRDGKALPAKC